MPAPPLHQTMQLLPRYSLGCNGFLPLTLNKKENCMNYTVKYHLPQWEESDRVMRTDFNQMCADIDSGIDRAAQLPYAVGRYDGTGHDMDIEVGFRPQFVVICTGQLGFVADNVMGSVSAAGETVTSSRITMTDTGFHVVGHDTKTRSPQVNIPGREYNYIAFR